MDLVPRAVSRPKVAVLLSLLVWESLVLVLVLHCRSCILKFHCRKLIHTMITRYLKPLKDAWILLTDTGIIGLGFDRGLEFLVVVLVLVLRFWSSLFYLALFTANLPTAISRLERCLSSLHAWFCHMCLNPAKSEATLLSTSHCIVKIRANYRAESKQNVKNWNTGTKRIMQYILFATFCSKYVTRESNDKSAIMNTPCRLECSYSVNIIHFHECITEKYHYRWLQCKKLYNCVNRPLAFNWCEHRTHAA